MTTRSLNPNHDANTGAASITELPSQWRGRAEELRRIGDADGTGVAFECAVRASSQVHAIRHPAEGLRQ
jgi:hypothetical protein